MKTAHKSILLLEALESRRLLSGLWLGTDIDGDAITVKLSGRGELFVTTEEQGLGEQIDTIHVLGTNRSSKLSVDARPQGGDGYVDVAAIEAVGETLKQISVDGNLGFLTVASVKKVHVYSGATLDGSAANWSIQSNVDEIHFLGSLDHALVEIAGDLKKVTIEGNMALASLIVDGQLRQMTVYGDVTEDSLIRTGGNINRLSIDGFLESSMVDTRANLKALYVGGDIYFADIWADADMGRIIVDGSIVETIIDAAGEIDKIDAWNWILDTRVVAGAELEKIYAYDIADTIIAADVDHTYLDADYSWAALDERYVIEDGVWYWSIVNVEDVPPAFYDEYAAWFDDSAYDYYGDTYYAYYEPAPDVSLTAVSFMA